MSSMLPIWVKSRLGKPNADTEWIDAKKAYYVIESSFIGGMGAEDALPFADKAQAEKFAKEKRRQSSRFCRDARRIHFQIKQPIKAV